MKLPTVLLVGFSALVILGSLESLLTHPWRDSNVITIAGIVMLCFAMLVTVYFEITKMRTDEQGRRYYYTVWGWFEEKVLRRPYNDDPPEQ